MQNKETVVIKDHATDTNISVPPDLQSDLEKLTRSLMAVYASHNTQINLKDAANGMKGILVPDAWYAIGLAFQRSVQSAAGIPWDLRQTQDTLRSVDPRLQERRVSGAGYGGFPQAERRGTLG